jgi:hypothetical protein
MGRTDTTQNVLLQWILCLSREFCWNTKLKDDYGSTAVDQFQSFQEWIYKQIKQPDRKWKLGVEGERTGKQQVQCLLSLSLFCSPRFSFLELVREAL